MRTTSEELIREYRAPRLVDRYPHHRPVRRGDRSAPAQLAVLDPPNREVLVGGAAAATHFPRASQSSPTATRCACSSSACGATISSSPSCPNIAEYPAIYLAALRLGIIVSPVPMQFRRHELEQIVDLTRCARDLTVRSMKGADLRVECRRTRSGSVAAGAVSRRRCSRRQHGLSPRQRSRMSRVSCCATTSTRSRSPPTTSPRSAGPRAPKACRRACRARTTIGSRSVTGICTVPVSGAASAC